MSTKQVRKMILAILVEADYDLAKSFARGQSEDPGATKRTMDAMVRIAIEHMTRHAAPPTPNTKGSRR